MTFLELNMVVTLLTCQFTIYYFDEGNFAKVN